MIATEPDPLHAYLERAYESLREAQGLYLARGTEENHQRLRTALEGVKQATLTVHGIACPKCDATGTLFYLDGAVSVQCGLCDGNRAVLPLTHRRWTEKHG